MAAFVDRAASQPILEIVRRSDIFRTTCAFLSRSDLPNWYITSGFIQQTYYNSRHGFDIHHGIKDIDVVYFEAQETDHTEREHQVEGQLTELLHGRIRVDVKNQAFVHLFYPRKFGYAIQPHSDVFAAIDSYPTTSTTVGITGLAPNERVYATFGLADLYGLVLRPNRAKAPKEVYDPKRRRIAGTWPLVRIEEWAS